MRWRETHDAIRGLGAPTSHGSPKKARLTYSYFSSFWNLKNSFWKSDVKACCFIFKLMFQTEGIIGISRLQMAGYQLFHLSNIEFLNAGSSVSVLQVQSKAEESKPWDQMESMEKKINTCCSYFYSCQNSTHSLSFRWWINPDEVINLMLKRWNLIWRSCEFVNLAHVLYSDGWIYYYPRTT